MYRQQFFPRLGDYIDTLLKVTKLTKSIVCVTGGMGGSTYNALKKYRHAFQHLCPSVGSPLGTSG
mgnify:CR=1 FL=1